MVLIGKTGSGKSASGNTILGENEFKSKLSAGSVTERCSYKRAERFGKEIMVVDTPGLFDTVMSNEKVMREIVKCVGITAPGPHVFLLVTFIGRFTKEEWTTVKYFIDIFGEHLFDHMIVLFAGRDNIDRDGIGINEYVESTATPELKEIIKKCNGHYLAINNVQGRDLRDKDAEKLLQDIAGMIGGNHFSNEMYMAAEEQLQNRIAEVKCQEEKEIERDRKQREEKIRSEGHETSEMDRKIQEIEKEHQIKLEQLEEKIRKKERERIVQEDERSLLASLVSLAQGVWTAFVTFFAAKSERI